MSPARLLQRNIRPTQPRSISEDSDAENSSSESEVGNAMQNGDAESEDGSVMDEDHSEDGEPDEEEAYERQISSVSFGALKQAQEVLQQKRKRSNEDTLDQNKKLDALRERLQEIRSQKLSEQNSGKKLRTKSTVRNDVPSKARPAEDESGDSSDSGDSDSDSAPSEEGAANRSRTSKHAPASQSSKYQVSRRRTVIDVPQRRYRDPRFDALAPRATPGGGGAVGQSSEQAYSFLREYQQAEVAELKEAARQTKDVDEREKLRRAAERIENRLQARAAQERTREVVRRHRRAERERIAEGKTPFFLKKKEIRERALVDKFAGMKPKDRERLMERRQKKEGQKEKRRMPNARRFAG